MTYIVGLDIGGTFTDVSAVNVDTGAIHTAKARSTPWDLIEGLVEGLELVAEQAGLATEELLADTEKFAAGPLKTSTSSSPGGRQDRPHHHPRLHR